MKHLIFLAIFLVQVPLWGQDTLDLDRCIEQAIEQAPKRANREEIARKGSLQQENLQTNWLPTLTLNGQVTYQSDVVSLEMDDPSIPFSFPDMPHEQVALNLDVEQTLYDGGTVARKKTLERIETETALQQLKVDLYGIRENITQLYFSVLLLQENRENVEIALDNLKRQETLVQAALENGTAMESDLHIIRVEIMEILQSLDELDARRNALIQMIAIHTGKELDPETVLKVPYLEVEEDSALARPEMELFELQSATLEAGKELVQTRRRPRVFAFGQAGYGLPGYNMLNDEWDTYYRIGAGLRWQILDWNQVKREQQIFDARKQMVHNARNSFEQQINAAMAKEREEMKHYRQAIEMDRKMLKMRREITCNAASRLENGVINATEYTVELNREQRVRVKLTTHKIKLLQSLATYKSLQGTL